MAKEPPKLLVRKRRRPRTDNPSIPIYNLTYDVLWYIFCLNQYIHDATTYNPEFKSDWHERSRDHESSLTHMRSISQVCKRWRDLTLETPSFWANAINLRLLNQEKGDWREEVIRRTGDALLNVRGTVSWAGEPSTRLLFSLLEDQWTRIRVLNLDLYDNGVARDPRWQTLYCPAPNLEIFRVRFHPHLSISDGGEIFSGSAPRLHFLSCDCSSLTPSGSTSWTNQLRALVISTFDLDLRQILDALNTLPLLEELQICTGAFKSKSWDVIGHDWPVAKPPCLKTLRIKNNFKNIIALLHQIVLLKECQLFVDAVNPDDYFLTSNELFLLRTSLTRHFSNFVGVNRLSWTSTYKLWELTGDSPSLTNCFRVTDDAHLRHAIYTLLAFSMSDLANGITQLEIELDRTGTIVTQNPDLLAFVRSLKSVETIYTGSETLQHLIHILDHATGSFPRLRTIVLQSGYYLKVDDIMRFLMRRRDASMPIMVFDLRQCRSPGQEKLLFLEGLDELSVLWDPEIRKKIDEASRDWTSVDSDD